MMLRQISSRKLQAANLFFSSWAILFLTIGIPVDEWVKLKLKTRSYISHSPWICCTTMLPEDKLKIVRMVLILVLSLSFLNNLFLGLESTYMIPQIKYIHLIPATLSFLAGKLLLFALLMYDYQLRQGRGVYYSNYNITWITFIAYLNVFFFIISGILSLVPQSHSCTCKNIVHIPPVETLDDQPSETSLKPTSLSERTSMPRSIVRTRCRSESLNRTHIQTRRVTWAL